MGNEPVTKRGEEKGMTQRSRLQKRAVVMAAVMGATLLALSGLAMASGSGQHEVTRVEDAKATVADLIEIQTKGAAEATTGNISITPGGHTAWHHHPGPHIVMVKAGTVRVYETDCTFKTYAAGQGFYDPGDVVHPHIHTAHNAEASGNVELAITDIREDDKRLTVVTNPPEPASCFAAAVPASAAVAPGPATQLPRTGGAGPPGLLAALGLSLVGAGAAACAVARRR